MPTRTARQYWDACLFIEILTGANPDRIKIIRQLIRYAKTGAIEIVISNLVIAEVRPKDENAEEDRIAVAELLETNRSYVVPYAVTRNIANRSREISAKFPNITVIDSIHVATAIEANCDVLFTYDGDHRNKPRRAKDLLKYDGQIGTPPLRIKVPNAEEGLELFKP